MKNFRVAELFLWLELDTAFRRLSIVCSLFRVQGQICVQKAGVQENQPNHTTTLGKHLCRRRLQHINPSQLHWMFREFPVSLGLQLAPKRYVRYVHLQLFVLFENQGLLAKSHHINFRKPRILGFLRGCAAKHFGLAAVT